MQINSCRPNSNQTFTSIKLASGAADVIKSKLSLGELNDFNEIVKMARHDEFVDLILFGKGENKLSGRIAENSKLDNKILCEKSQRFWESPMDFIKRMYDKTLHAENKSRFEYDRRQAVQKLIDEIGLQ